MNCKKENKDSKLKCKVCYIVRTAQAVSNIHTKYNSLAFKAFYKGLFLMEKDCIITAFTIVDGEEVAAGNLPFIKQFVDNYVM